MPRSSTSPKTAKRRRLKALPWAALLRGGVAVRRRWHKLSEKDRARLGELLRESGWRPHKLAPKQRRELRGLIGKLDLAGLSRELAPIFRSRRGARKRHRCR
jgi:hypothetical protein